MSTTARCYESASYKHTAKFFRAIYNYIRASNDTIFFAIRAISPPASQPLAYWPHLISPHLAPTLNIWKPPLPNPRSATELSVRMYVSPCPSPCLTLASYLSTVLAVPLYPAASYIYYIRIGITGFLCPRPHTRFEAHAARLVASLPTRQLCMPISLLASLAIAM